MITYHDHVWYAWSSSWPSSASSWTLFLVSCRVAQMSNFQLCLNKFKSWLRMRWQVWVCWEELQLGELKDNFRPRRPRLPCSLPGHHEHHDRCHEHLDCTDFNDGSSAGGNLWGLDGDHGRCCWCSRGFPPSIIIIIIIVVIAIVILTIIIKNVTLIMATRYRYIRNAFIQGWPAASVRGKPLQLLLLCHLHRLRLLLHPQPLHRGHHWQLQCAKKEG